MAFFRTLPGKITLAVLFVLVLAALNGPMHNRAIIGAFYQRIVMLIGIAIILSVSLNLVNGVTGQFSIGHAGFMAIGSYVGAAFTVYGQHRFLPHLEKADFITGQMVLLAALLAAGLAAAVAGFVVGLPSLRLRGDYLAIVTLGFGEIIRVCILNIEAVGGSAGFRGISGPAGFVSIAPLTNFFWVYLVVVVVVLFSRNLLRSSSGLELFSIRDDEIAAEAMGVPTTRLKVTAFVMSAFYAGVAGCLFAHYDRYLAPETFNFLRSIEIVTMVVLGGMGSISGAIVGAIILAGTPELLKLGMSSLAQRGALPKGLSPDLIRQLLYALLLIILMLTRPQGIFGHREITILGLFKRKSKPQAPAAG